MLSFTRGLAVCLFLGGLRAAAPAAVITFDDLNTGGPGGAGASVVVTNQYAVMGVTFNFLNAFDYSKGSLAIPNFAHSGTVAVETCYAAEFCTSPITANFTAGQTRVKAWVGVSYPLSQAIPVVMRGFNAGGTEVTSSTITLPANPSAPTNIRFPIEIGRFAADIFRVDISFFSSGGNTYFNNGLAMDDLEFSTIGPPPPCPATVPPALTLSQPTNNTTMRCNRFLFQDTAVSGDPFARRIVSVQGPTMGQRNSWTTQVGAGNGGPTWVYGALFPGVNTVTDRIEDCKGFIERSVTVTYDPIPSETSITVLGFEPTQSVQTMPNSVPLIADKRTVVRVYVQLGGPLTSLSGVRGTLSCFLPGSPSQYNLGAAIAPYNVQSLNAVTVNQTTGLQAARRSLTASLNFEIPASWTEAGKVHFALTGVTVDGCDTRLNVLGGDNVLPFGYYAYNTFSSAPPVRVRIVKVPYRTSSGGTVFTPRDKDVDMLESWLRRAYPTPQVISSHLTLATRTGTPDGSFSADDINSQLQDVRSMETSSGAVDNRTHYYGMVDDGGGFMRGKADGIPSWVASGPTGPGTFGWDTDGSYGDWYGGHELGHTFGRFHAKFCGAEECFTFIWTFCPDGYVPYPYISGLLASDWTYGNYGFDVGDSAQGISRAVYRPDIFHDVMTYCDSEWLSDFNYNGILDRLRAENPSGDARVKRAKITDALMVSAKMNLTQDTAQLRPFWRLPNLDATDRPTTSHYSIQLKDAANNNLAVYLFAPKVDTEAVVGEDFTASLSEVVPWVAGTKRIVIMRDNVEMASRTVTTNTPVVHVTAPNGGENLTGATADVKWTGTDADGQQLTYALQYSRDAGQNWLVVDTGFQTTSYTVDLDRIPGSATALFRVVATDGVNTAMDASDGTFTVRTKPPTVKLLAPENAAQYTSDDTIILTGEGTDIEDGTLTGTALQWTSNIQGVIGTGPSTFATLLPGKHTITLTATDSGGAHATATTEITVTAAPPVADAGSDRYVVVGAPAPLDASRSTGVPTLNFSWTIADRPDGSTADLTNPNSVNPGFTPDRVGRYVLQLTVTDGTGTSAVASVTIIATNAVGALRIVGGLAASSSADMAGMDVEHDGASASHIDIADAVRLARRTLLDREGGGVATVTAQNRYSTYGVYLNDPRLNGSPDIRLLVCHQFVGNYNQQMAVWYDSGAQMWVAYNEDRSALALNERVNYAFSPSFGSVTRGATGGPFPWGVTLDDPRINFNPNAVVLATHDYVANYGGPLGVYYDGARWAAYNETFGAIPNIERYFWADASASGGRVVVDGGNTYFGYGVYLNDARINGNSGAIVLAQHMGVSGYNSSPIGIWFDGSRWVAYNEDRTTLASGEAVNYLIVQP